MSPVPTVKHAASVHSLSWSVPSTVGVQPFGTSFAKAGPLHAATPSVAPLLAHAVAGPPLDPEEPDDPEEPEEPEEPDDPEEPEEPEEPDEPDDEPPSGSTAPPEGVEDDELQARRPIERKRK
jgi:hypothetical protein